MSPATSDIYTTVTLPTQGLFDCTVSHVEANRTDTHVTSLITWEQWLNWDFGGGEPYFFHGCLQCWKNYMQFSLLISLKCDLN